MSFTNIYEKKDVLPYQINLTNVFNITVIFIYYNKNIRQTVDMIREIKILRVLASATTFPL